MTPTVAEAGNRSWVGCSASTTVVPKRALCAPARRIREDSQATSRRTRHLAGGARVPGRPAPKLRWADRTRRLLADPTHSRGDRPGPRDARLRADSERRGGAD